MTGHPTVRRSICPLRILVSDLLRLFITSTYLWLQFVAYFIEVEDNRSRWWWYAYWLGVWHGLIILVRCIRHQINYRTKSKSSASYSDLCRVELVVEFPARGSTQVLLCLFPCVLWLWHFLNSVGPHPVSSYHIYRLLCRGHSWRVPLAKQETLTPAGHPVSPLICRGPWMSTVVLYCWCHSDSASVLLYFTLSIGSDC